MSEEEKDVHVEVGADIAKVETEELEASPKVSAEKLRKAQLLDEINAEVSVTRELPKRNKPTAKIPDKSELARQSCP